MFHKAQAPLPRRIRDDEIENPDFRWSDLGWLLLGILILGTSTLSVIIGIWWLIGALV